MVQWPGKQRYIPKVDFRRCLDVESQWSLYTCNIVKSVEVSFLILTNISVFKAF